MHDHKTILYRSIARSPDLDPSDVDILKCSLRHNSLHGITGYLCRIDGQFYQSLYGGAALLDALMSRIIADSRHSEVEVLIDAPASAQSPFAGWAMGYDHFIGHDLGVSLDENGQRPAIDAAKARAVEAAMIRSAEEMLRYGSSLPFARQPGESERNYMRRIGADA